VGELRPLSSQPAEATRASPPTPPRRPDEGEAVELTTVEAAVDVVSGQLVPKLREGRPEVVSAQPEPKLWRGGRAGGSRGDGVEPANGQSGATRPTFQPTGRGNKGFAADTAAKTGRNKRNINKALARAAKIAPDVLDAVRGTPPDTGASLDRDQHVALPTGQIPPALPPASPDKPVENPM